MHFQKLSRSFQKIFSVSFRIIEFKNCSLKISILDWLLRIFFSIYISRDLLDRNSLSFLLSEGPMFILCPFLLLCLPSPARNRVSNLRVFDSNSVMEYFFVSIISLHSRGINLPRQSDSGIILPRQIDSVGLSWTYAAFI